MVRSLAISLAAAAALTAGSTLSVDARNAGGHMSMGAGHTMSTSHVGTWSGGPGRMGPGHMWMGHHDFRHDRFVHRRFFHGRFFAFAPYDDDYTACRVWTPYGWRWTYACYSYY